MPPEVRATYRLQLHKGFTFEDAAALVDYLDELGVSHLYCSPYLQARAGSTHGYDVVDHTRLNDELGGGFGHAGMVERLQAAGLGHIVDMVPNHMTIAERDNVWWWDVLKRGPESPYAGYFDIDWHPSGAGERRSILVPILGDHYGRALASEHLALRREASETVVSYFDHLLPVADGTVDPTRLDTINADRDALHEVLEAQHYRLAFWRTAGHELNYRRFFAINDLAALRMENREVFDHVHRLVLELIQDGRLDGLRIDHVDGLRYPRSYLERLRARAPDAYIVVEKIVHPRERLPDEWPVGGTTGYDFLNLVNGLFVDPDGEKPLTEIYARFTGESTDLEHLERAKKLLMMDIEFATDIERLTDMFVSICDQDRDSRDFTRYELRETLRETIAAFPVYRTYADARTKSITAQDLSLIDEATEAARARRGDLDGHLFDLLRSILSLERSEETCTALAMRFQQTTGPIMAKGVEDTLFYTFNRLASLNEVGGDPGRFGTSVEEFHARASETLARWPRTMLATSTHDTKRSEDVRARLNLLSEIPDQWAGAVNRWSEINERHRIDGIPDRNAEYLLYQTLVAAWPLETGRAVAYMEKAAKEAKVRTSWLDPDPHYDEGLRRFIEATMADDAFVSELGDFISPLVDPGRINSLSQTLIKLTWPGVPDLYQGTELWDLSLVDPDNRRPVDYDERRRLLREIVEWSPEDAWAERDSGAPKLFVTQRALDLRRRRPQAFGRASSYTALEAQGDKAGHLLAYCRGGDVVAAVPRLVLGLNDEWLDTTVSLPEGAWENVFTGEGGIGGVVAAFELFGPFPVALLESTTR